jgi:peptide/nickel transport system substrate-binding protein
MAGRRAVREGLPVLRLGVAVLVACLAAVCAEGAEKALVYHLEGRPASLDPAMAVSEREHHALWHLCDALLNISRDGKTLEPGLAEFWKTTPDSRQVTVKLRPGLLFHSGAVLDAHAVKASLERQLRVDEIYRAEQKSVKAQMLNELITAVDVQDPLTVVLRLKYPGLHYLSQMEIVNADAAARLGKEFARQPDCAGPFKLSRWDDDQIVMTANDRYWGGRPKIDRLVFQVISEGKAVVDALLKGRVDFSPGATPDPAVFERLRDSERVRLVPVPRLNVYYLGFYTDKPPFNDVAVRRAVAHGINVGRIALFLGRGSIAPAKGPLPPAMKGYDPTANQASYDPDMAKELLRKTGHSTGLSVGLVHNQAVPFHSEFAGAIQNDLRRVGINVESLGKPNWKDVTTAVQAREGHMFIYGWNVRAPYPERILMPLFHSRSVGTMNLTHYKSAELDRQLDEAFRLPEGPGQASIYSLVQKQIVADAPMVFLYHLTWVAAHTDRLRGLELNLGSLPHDKLVRVDLVP